MNRLWDERYNAGNVATVLAFDQWRPLRTHYPTLSYLPQVATLKIYETARSLPALESAPPSFGVAPDGRAFLTPVAVRVCRVIQTLVGTASLFVVFLIGRRLFGPWAGCGAAFLLAIAPWHLRQSGVFKPDIMLVLTAVLALYAMLRARRVESLGSYAFAGALVGATAAAKWNGAALALPLVVTVALGGISKPDILLRRLGAATAAGASVLLALNPWLVLAPELYRRHLGSTVSHYQERLAEVGAGFFAQPLNAVSSIAGSIYFGPVLGSAALLGLAWMLVFALRGGRGVASALPRGSGTATIADAWILLTFSVGYVVALWTVTRYPKPPNWLIVAPVAALATAWFIGRLAHAGTNIPNRRLRGAAAAALASVAGLAGIDKVRFVHATVYEENVPLTSTEAARAAGARKPLRGRTFMTELPLGDQDFDPRIWDSNYVVTLIRTDNIAGEARQERETADVLLFAASRLEVGEHPAYRELTVAGSGASVRRFEPRLFYLRGDPVVLVRQPFEPLRTPGAVPFAAADEGIHEVSPTALQAEDGAPEHGRRFVSFEVAVRTLSRDVVSVAIEVNGNRLTCRHTQKGSVRRRCLTPRFEAPQSPVRILVQPAREVIEVTAFHWLRPG